MAPASPATGAGLGRPSGDPHSSVLPLPLHREHLPVRGTLRGLADFCPARIRLSTPLRGRHLLLRLVHRPGAPASPAPARDGEPLYQGAASCGACVDAPVRRPLGGDARGDTDQTASGSSEARPAGLSAM